jgi:hypothetical protein
MIKPGRVLFKQPGERVAARGQLPGPSKVGIDTATPRAVFIEIGYDYYR